MLGRYENFPENVHSVARFDFRDPTKSVQQAILCAFHRLNYEVYDLSAVTPYLKQKCEVSFELGVAEGDAFNFLNKNALAHCLQRIEENEFQTLDFFFVIRYHTIIPSGDLVPLRFDYHVLRLIFQKNWMDMRIRHEKGTQRIQLDDLTDFIAKIINAEFYSRRLNPIVSAFFEKVGFQ